MEGSWRSVPEADQRFKAGKEIYVHYGEDYWIKKAEWEAKLSSTVVELSSTD